MAIKFYSILFYSILFYFILFYSILFQCPLPLWQPLGLIQVLLQAIHKDYVFGLAQVDIHTLKGFKDKFHDYRPSSSLSHCPRRMQSKQGTVQQESATSAPPTAVIFTATVVAAMAAVAAEAAAAAGSQRQHRSDHHRGEEAPSSPCPSRSLWCDPLQPL